MPSSSVFWSAVRLSPVQSSPVHWCAVQSIQWNLRPSSPIPIHSLPAKYISIQRRPGPYKSTAVESSLVQSIAVQTSAIRNSSAQSRPVQSRTTNCRWVQHNAVPLSLVRNTQVHCSPSRQLKCYSEKSTLNPIQAYFSPVLSSVVTPTRSRASTYGIVIYRSFLIIP